MRGGNFVFATHRASVLSGEGGEALGGGIAELCAGVACVLIYYSSTLLACSRQRARHAPSADLGSRTKALPMPTHEPALRSKSRCLDGRGGGW